MYEDVRGRSRRRVVEPGDNVRRKGDRGSGRGDRGYSGSRPIPEPDPDPRSPIPIFSRPASDRTRHCDDIWDIAAIPGACIASPNEPPPMGRDVRADVAARAFAPRSALLLTDLLLTRSELGVFHFHASAEAVGDTRRSCRTAPRFPTAAALRVPPRADTRRRRRRLSWPVAERHRDAANSASFPSSPQDRPLIQKRRARPSLSWAARPTARHQPPGLANARRLRPTLFPHAIDDRVDTTLARARPHLLPDLQQIVP